MPFGCRSVAWLPSPQSGAPYGAKGRSGIVNSAQRRPSRSRRPLAWGGGPGAPGRFLPRRIGGALIERAGPAHRPQFQTGESLTFRCESAAIPVDVALTDGAYDHTRLGFSSPTKPRVWGSARMFSFTCRCSFPAAPFPPAQRLAQARLSLGRRTGLGRSWSREASAFE